ncbi:oligosaccharide flippase family protein [Acinetobacter lwoffii]|uniref:oligosaccharide flippase family protein n=1 Tax=Acinetobacter lwoffii TaxID=28090 RepID=UPI001C5BBB8E|nr:oligosaccharide flippase family protein [Acinetobacter lwoffii]QXX85731.1 oligosaccharide flippase family protein [Acinetobacter lwoffii]
MKAKIEKLGLLLLGTLLGSGANLLIQTYLAREFSLKEYGIYISILNIINLLTPFIGFGIASFMLRVYMVEGGGAKRWLKGVYEIIFYSSLTVFFLLQLWGWVNNKNLSMFAIYTFFFIYMLGTSLNGFMLSRLQIENKVRVLSLWQLIPNSLKLAFILFLFLFFEKSILNISIAYALSGLLVCVFSINSLHKMRSGSVFLSFDNKNKNTENVSKIDLIRSAFPYGLTGIFYLIYMQSSIMIVTFLKGYEEVAYLGLALVFLTALCLIPSLFFQKLYMPKIYNWSNTDKIKLKNFYIKNTIIWGVLSIAIIILYFIFIKYFFVNIFGPKYDDRIEIFYFISLLVFVKYFTLNSGSIMNTEKLIDIKAKLMTKAAIANIILSIILVSYWGIYGAIMALILVEFFILLSFYKCIKNEYGF